MRNPHDTALRITFSKKKVLKYAHDDCVGKFSSFLNITFDQGLGHKYRSKIYEDIYESPWPVSCRFDYKKAERTHKYSN